MSGPEHAPPGLEPILLALALSAILGLYRLVRGPSVPDRVVALDLIALLAVALIATQAVASGESVLLDVALVIALVSFLATVAFARYIDRRQGPPAAPDRGMNPAPPPVERT